VVVSSLASALRRAVDRLVDAGGRFPALVLGAAAVALVATWTYASRLELRSDFLELLPRDSPGFRAFEHQLGRVGGGASLIVVCESPEPRANERLIDALAGALARAPDPRVAYVESGTKEVKRFFESHTWLYAEAVELEDAERTLDRQIAIRSGLVEDLESDDTPAATPAGATTPSDPSERKAALGMAQFRDRWKAKAREHDDFPTGYFATADRTRMALRIVSTTSGTGDRGGDALLAHVEALVAEIGPTSIHPAMRVGFAGDIPNAIAEKDSLVGEAAGATGLAFVLVLGGVVWF
jgi:hypothetical protein